MAKKFSDEELLMLSGIQHIAFCERQWAFIHIEQQWAENVLTVEGHNLHQRVDNPYLTDNNENKITLRSVPLVSYELGLSGLADVIEFLITESEINSIRLPNKQGFWQPIPVEYKRGKPKPDERDEVQLCAQAMCLEEMYKIYIPAGFLFYGETRHRHEVEFNESIRNKVCHYANRMHELFREGKTPTPVYKPHCRSCSLFNICLPLPLSKYGKVSDYLEEYFGHE